MKKQKGIAGITALIVVLLMMIVAGLYGMNAGWFESGAAVSPGAVLQCADPGTARTVTIRGVDALYNPGVEITEVPYNYRKSGTSVWTDGPDATFSASAGVRYDIGFFNTTTATTAEPQVLDKIQDTILIPCDSESAFEYRVSNDALYTDLTARALDPADGNVISSTATIDIDAGGPVSIPIDWFATFQENYGTLACGAKSNIVIVRLNSTAFEEEKTDFLYNGASLKKLSSPPNHLASLTGHTDVAFEFPVLQSSTGTGTYPFILVLDPDNTVGPGQGGPSTNTTLYLYDSAIYYDNNDNEVKCGVEDETNSIIGATAADQLVIYTEQD